MLKEKEFSHEVLKNPKSQELKRAILLELTKGPSITWF
jgi:hypothetical protein